MVHGPADAGDLAYRNLASVCANYRVAGIAHLLVAAAIENRVQLDRIAASAAARRVVVCRLTAAIETMQARVRTREPGKLQSVLVQRVAQLEAMLDAAAVEDFIVSNDGRHVTDVARDVLRGAGWNS